MSLPYEILVQIILEINDVRTYLNFIKSCRDHWYASKIIISKVINKFLAPTGDSPDYNKVLPNCQKHGIWYKKYGKSFSCVNYLFGKKEGIFVRYLNDTTLIFRNYKNNLEEGYSVIYTQINNIFILTRLKHNHKGKKDGTQFYFQAEECTSAQILQLSPFLNITDIKSINALRDAFQMHLKSILLILHNRTLLSLKVKLIENYKDKKLHGQVVKFVDGRIFKIEHYLNGFLHGISRTYDTHGNEIHSTNWSIGRPSSQ